MRDIGLLGVGSGVTKPRWVGSPTQKRQVEGTPEPMSAPMSPNDEVTVRDQRLVTEAVQEFSNKVEFYTQTWDMASVAANDTENHDMAVTSPGKVTAGDVVLWLGSSTLDHGLLPQLVGVASPANDTVRVRVSNVTGAPIDPISMTHSFLIFRNVTE